MTDRSSRNNRVSTPTDSDLFTQWLKTNRREKYALDEFSAFMAGLEIGRGRCLDCERAVRHSYSDATTPGFFHDKCAKHRAQVAK